MKKPVSPKGGIKKSTDLELKLKRVLADYQNQKKRFEREKIEFIKFASVTIIDKLLSVLDDLERAGNHLKDEGLNLSINQFKSVLKSEEVEEIELKNTVFDPQTADCAELVKGKKDHIIEIIKKGYTLNGKVLRPAQVKVGKGDK